MLPHTARARSGRIWPPGSGVLSRHRPHVSPAAATMPVMRRRGGGRHTALRRVEGITVSHGDGRGERARSRRYGCYRSLELATLWCADLDVLGGGTVNRRVYSAACLAGPGPRLRASWLIRREITGSDAAGPNSAGCSRSMATSARQSPPGARATARSAMIFPGSWMAWAARHSSSPCDSRRLRPVTCSTRVSSRAPAWDTIPDPPASTMTLGPAAGPTGRPITQAASGPGPG
jgi:hypothetical protein